MDTLVIDESSSEQRLQLATELLEDCNGVVVLDGIATLWPRSTEFECAVAIPSHSIAKCEEEYKVLVENAARALQASKLASRMPERPLRWVVVDDYGNGSVELWRAP